VLSTQLLSKVLGIFVVLIGAMIMIRRQYFLSVFAQFVEQRLTRTVISMAEVLGGLFLVIGHNDWSSLPAALVTAIGWMALAEGLIYLLLPDALVDRFIRTFNTEAWYAVGAVLAIVVGAYLAAHGFGWIGPGA
jgi:tRNA threonylcarbamoyladenosine modification (KEOPS) complex  Pcc1 subunit